MWDAVTVRIVVLAVVCTAITYEVPEQRIAGAEPQPAQSQAPVTEEGGHAGSLTGRIAPEKAYDLLAALKLRNGEPLPGYVGGRQFQNRERRLPRGNYREYDVNRKISGRSRNAERIVIEQNTGKAYYTNDHYRTFVPLN